MSAGRTRLREFCEIEAGRIRRVVSDIRAKAEAELEVPLGLALGTAANLDALARTLGSSK